jgi:hypothetical protein
MNADGTNPRQVTNSPENELLGDWSPDKKYVVVDYISFFTRKVPPIFELAAVEVSTGTVTKLTSTEAINEEHPFWVY